MMNPIADSLLYQQTNRILEHGWYKIPDEKGYRGSQGPGKLLELLLGIDGGNSDTPDAGKWEIKFHGGSSLLTLMHLEAGPKGHLHEMVQTFGIIDQYGRKSFRHTLFNNRSSKGLYIINEEDRLIVKYKEDPDILWSYWTHDRLLNAFISKLRRLIVVSGRKKNGFVNYEMAHLFWEPKVMGFVKAVEGGMVAIDFDARTKNGRGLRNQGTKFRIDFRNLPLIYRDHRLFESPEEARLL